MENQLQIFSNEEFGQVRVLGDSDNPLFCLSDLCRILELRIDNVVTRLKKNPISNGVLSKHPVQTSGGVQQMYFVNEDGFYDVLLDSRKPIAKRLRKRITHDVLTSIRKTGSYSLVQPAPVVAKPVRVPNPNRVAAQLADASVYVIRVGEEYVKIGNSKNVEERKASLKSWRGLPFGEDYKTVRFPRTIARKIENACQQIFSPYHVEGEIFHVKYEMARLALKALEQLVENLPLISNPKFGDKLLKIAEMMGDTPERKALLLEAGNIFVGKKSV